MAGDSTGKLSLLDTDTADVLFSFVRKSFDSISNWVLVKIPRTQPYRVALRVVGWWIGGALSMGVGVIRL